MGDWIDEKCDLDKKAETTSVDLFESFKDWFKDNESKKYEWTRRRFGISLMKSQPDLHKYKNNGGITCYKGITLK